MVKVWKTVQNIVAKILGEEKAINLVEYLIYCWNGKEMLFKMFWAYLVAVNVVLGLLFVLPISSTGGRLAESIALLIVSPYVVWSVKSTWASVDNIENPDFKGIPRVYLSLAAKIYIVWFVVNFVLALLG